MIFFFPPCYSVSLDPLGSSAQMVLDLTTLSSLCANKPCWFDVWLCSRANWTAQCFQKGCSCSPCPECGCEELTLCQMCVQCCSAGLRSAGVGTKQGRQLLINGLGSWMWEGAQKCAFWQHWAVLSAYLTQEAVSWPLSPFSKVAHIIVRLPSNFPP